MQLLVNIDVDNLASAVTFYCSAFGLTVGRRFGTEGVELLGAASPIYLLAKAEGSSPSDFTTQRRTTAGTGPRSIWTLSVPEIEPALQRAVAAGAKLEQPVRTSNWGRLALSGRPIRARLLPGAVSWERLR